MTHNHLNQNMAEATVISRRSARTPSASETWLRAGMPLLLAMLISGCATGGVYRNQSTPDRIDVVATDQAAVEAAKSAQSQVGMSNQAQGGYQGGAYRGAAYSPPSPYQQLQNNVSQALVNSASSALSGAIYSLVNRVAYR